MKMASGIVFFISVLLAGCASLPPEVKEAVENAKSLELSAGVLENQVELLKSEYESQLCFMEIGKKGKIIGKEKDRVVQYRRDGADTSGIILKPGMHTLVFGYEGATGMESLHGNYEAGKHYYLEWKIQGTGDVDFKRHVMTDPKQLEAANKQISLYKEKLPPRITKIENQIRERDAFLAFSKENPNYFEGTSWSAGNGAVLKFKDKRVLVKPPRGDRYYDVTYKFNKNTLIIIWAADERRDIWYYTRSENTLIIHGGERTWDFDFKGTYVLTP